MTNLYWAIVWAGIAHSLTFFISLPVIKKDLKDHDTGVYAPNFVAYFIACIPIINLVYWGRILYNNRGKIRAAIKLRKAFRNHPDIETVNKINSIADDMEQSAKLT